MTKGHKNNLAMVYFVLAFVILLNSYNASNSNRLRRETLVKTTVYNSSPSYGDVKLIASDSIGPLGRAAMAIAHATGLLLAQGLFAGLYFRIALSCIGRQGMSDLLNSSFGCLVMSGVLKATIVFVDAICTHIFIIICSRLREVTVSPRALRQQFKDYQLTVWSYRSIFQLKDAVSLYAGMRYTASRGRVILLTRIVAQLTSTLPELVGLYYGADQCDKDKCEEVVFSAFVVTPLLVIVVQAVRLIGLTSILEPILELIRSFLFQDPAPQDLPSLDHYSSSQFLTN